MDLSFSCSKWPSSICPISWANEKFSLFFSRGVFLRESNIEAALSASNYKDELAKIKKEISTLESRAKKLVDFRIEDKIDESSYEEKYEELS